MFFLPRGFIIIITLHQSPFRTRDSFLPDSMSLINELFGVMASGHCQSTESGLCISPLGSRRTS